MTLLSSRRKLMFGGTAAATLTALGLSTRGTTQTISRDYRALVCIYLNGGNDGNNTLVPLDKGYLDYARSRGSLALANAELIQLPSSSNGRPLGLHPSCRELARLYDEKKLAFVLNTGPLIRPVTKEQVLGGTADLPPALFSHTDQSDVVQGWQGGDDQSGWAGRALESSSLDVGDLLKGISNSQRALLLKGQAYSPAFFDINGSSKWGQASLVNSSDPIFRALRDLAAIKPNENPYLAEYSRSLSTSLEQSAELARAIATSSDPQTPFGATSLDDKLRFLAKLLPVFKQAGYQRQVFMVDWGAFDTHTGQRGGDILTQDYQLGVVSKAMGSFQAALDVAGLSENVTTFMMTEFSRTLMPATSNGSDHAWGNHFWVMGGRVRGGTVYGQLPDLVLGGKDDCDDEKEGRFVPTIATDQYGATLLNWLGISPLGIARAFPNLGNFPIQDLGFMA